MDRKLIWITSLLFILGLNVDRLNSKAVDGDSLNFLVIGDWGGLPQTPFYTAIEKAVAQRMGEFAAQNQVQFVVALGDNFYYDGVTDVDDKRFQETYDHVFRIESLSVDWYLVGGNHDHNGNISAEIEFSKLEKRWIFPNYYYTKQFVASSAKVDLVMIDTVILCGNSDDDVLGLQPEGPTNQKMADDQWAWIEQTLINSKADYLIVGGHYPVFSISSHGPTKCLVQNLLPLLHKYRASAYFCGHDHNLQHLQYTTSNSTVEYFLSGAANFIDTSTKHESNVPPGSSKFFWADADSFGGFGFVEVTPEKLDFSFYAASGKMLYAQSLTPRAAP